MSDQTKWFVFHKLEGDWTYSQFATEDGALRFVNQRADEDASFEFSVVKGEPVFFEKTPKFMYMKRVGRYHV